MRQIENVHFFVTKLKHLLTITQQNLLHAIVVAEKEPAQRNIFQVIYKESLAFSAGNTNFAFEVSLHFPE